jgi:redox-sensitive bicupin YhaK (pirin superfamily)
VSNLEDKPDEVECHTHPATGIEVMTPRDVPLGGPRAMTVRRTLPQRERSLIGAWCFLDHYGPDNVADTGGMSVAPHPHTGLQTVSWLFTGEVEHRDSAGHHAMVRPGELNLMTAGHGISHSEVSTPSTTVLHGAQLWVALPESRRQVPPAFEHHAELPTVAGGGGLRGTVILGELDGATSPGTAYTPITGADLTLAEGTDARLPLQSDFEYAVMSMSGEAEADGVRLSPGSMLYLGAGRTELPLRAATHSSLMLLGGEPFAERIVMWWNFVGRSGEDIVEARTEWQDAAAARFGEVHGYAGPRLEAPDLPPTPLKPRGRTR